MPINNNSIFGAFTLGEVRSGRLTGDWLNKETVANYGWFGGGRSSLALSTVNRIDFSNDSVTASVRGSLSLARYKPVATGNSNYGWFSGGGLLPSFVILSTVDRIDFSNDIATATPRGPLSSVRYDHTATGNSNYGWFGGGCSPALTPRSIVDRIDFSNDAETASVRGNLSVARKKFSAIGNSNYGWFGGGQTPISTLSTVDRIDFSNDIAAASPRGVFSNTKYSTAAVSNSNYGWFGGGRTPVVSFSRVDRFDFSNDLTTALDRGPLTAAKSYFSATGNSNFGWFAGGFPPVTTGISVVDRFDFSNDLTIASPRGPLSSSRYDLASTSGVLNIRRQKAENYGWFGGGATPTVTSTVDRIDFSNDSVIASTKGVLSLERGNVTATGNSNYGWYAGGNNSSTLYSIVDRIDFSNDSVTALSRGILRINMQSASATGNSNYGWFGGGFFTSVSRTSTIDRIDFSNDLALSNNRSTFTSVSNGIFGQAATGNSNYGWFGGGASPSVPTVRSQVDRLNFSNDGSTISIRGPLSSARYGLAATGNSNYGWFGGGYAPASTPKVVTLVDRIDFSNDSATASVRSPLSSARYNFAATGNSNYGWFGAGSTTAFPFTLVATVDRINFSNDLTSASSRGSLNTSRYGLAATTNTPIG